MPTQDQIAFWKTVSTPLAITDLDGTDNIFWINAIKKSLKIGNRNYITELIPPIIVLQQPTGIYDPQGQLPLLRTYYYIIVAVDSNYREIAASDEQSVTLTGNQNAVQLSWSEFTDATYYRIYRGTKSREQDRYYSVTHPTTTYTDKNLAATFEKPHLYSADLWITAGAYWDGTYWRRSDNDRTAFGINIRGYTNFPYESEQGAALWRAVPGGLGTIIDWELGWDLTAFRDFVVGGNGIEIDGGSSPYGRIVHRRETAGKFDTNPIVYFRHSGVLKNVYVDYSGRDDTTKESWFAGIIEDSFRIRRAPSGGSTIDWQEFLQINSSKDIGVGSPAPTGITLSGRNDGDFPTDTYYYRITALDGMGETAGVTEVSIGIGSNYENSYNGVHVSWTAVTGATSYRVFRRRKEDNESRYFTTTNTYYDDITLASGTGGIPPSETTTFLNKIAATGNSWLMGGNVGIGTKTPGAKLDIAGNVQLKNIGNKFLVKEGTNASMGTATLGSGGSVTVNNTLVTLVSRIFLTPQDVSGTAGSVYISARSAGTSFTIKSTSNGDRRTIAWFIVEPVPAA